MSIGMNRKLTGDICRMAAVAVFFIAAIIILDKTGVRAVLMDAQSFRFLLQGGGSPVGRMVSASAFVVVGGCIIALGMPRLWASAVGGVMYGVFTGTLLSILASLVGASILYCCGKFLLAGVVERRMGSRLKYWQKRFQENAFWWVLYGRLFPFSNSTLMSLLCGSCNVPFAAYVQGSLLGFIPLAVVFAAFGSGSLEGNLRQIVFASSVMVAVILIRWLTLRRAPAASHESVNM